MSRHEKHLHQHDFLLQDEKIQANEKKTLIVVILTFVTMIVEVTFGYITGSMALLADGWHMASHVGALGISLIAYKLARSEKLKNGLSFGTGKLIPLGGYTSALLLAAVAIIMGIESFERFLNPVEINFPIAILVSLTGLIVNVLSALILSDGHHHHEHEHHHHDHDLNHQSALIHVIADALTSVFAIVALLLGKYFGWNWADPLMGVLGSIIILKWAWGLGRDTLWELLDGKSTTISEEKVKQIFSSDEGVEIVDLHIWRIAPNAIACELMVYSANSKGTDFYREKLLKEVSIQHLIIEEKTDI